MKEYIPIFIIVSLVLTWTEIRYQKLFSHVEKLEQAIDIQKTKNTYQNGEQHSQTEKSSPQNSYKPNQKIVQKASKKSKKTEKRREEQYESKSLDLDDPDIQEELHQFLEEREKEQKEIQRAEGIGQYLDYIDKKIETYAQNHQLPASVSQAVMLEIQARTNEYLAVEHAAEDGELDWSEAKPEMVRIKEEGKINLTELLGGEEEYQEFERFVWGGK